MSDSHGLLGAQARRWLWMTVPIAVFFGPSAVAWAQALLKTWAPGETLTAEDLNANFAALQRAIVAPRVVTQPFTTPVVAAGEFPFIDRVQPCTEEGTVLIGGGCAIDNAEWTTYASEPDGNGWRCRFKAIGNLLNADPNGQAGTVASPGRVHAICAPTPM
jgi:hypothetical protein